MRRILIVLCGIVSATLLTACASENFFSNIKLSNPEAEREAHDILYLEEAKATAKSMMLTATSSINDEPYQNYTSGRSKLLNSLPLYYDVNTGKYTDIVPNGYGEGTSENGRYVYMGSGYNDNYDYVGKVISLTSFTSGGEPVFEWVDGN